MDMERFWCLCAEEDQEMGSDQPSYYCLCLSANDRNCNTLTELGQKNYVKSANSETNAHLSPRQNCPFY